MYIFVYNQNFFKTLSLFQIVTWYLRPRVLKAGDYCVKLSLIIILFVLVAGGALFYYVLFPYLIISENATTMRKLEKDWTPDLKMKVVTDSPL